MTSALPTHVVVDANILINLCHVGRLKLLEDIPNHAFLVPDHVVAEITNPAQQALVQALLAAGKVRQLSITDQGAIAEFVRLNRIIGSGESACLALAQLNNWGILSSDQRRPFTRAAQKMLPAGHLIDMIALYVLAIRAGLLTVADADADKAVLDQHRFTMKLATFADVI